MQKFWTRGEPFIWGTGAALALILVMTVGLLTVVMVNGLGVFWPRSLQLLTLADGHRLLGQATKEEKQPGTALVRQQFKVGNREMYGADFRWLESGQVLSSATPPEALLVERLENGNFFGFLKDLTLPNLEVASGGDPSRRLTAALSAVDSRRQALDRFRVEIAKLNRQLDHIAEALKKTKNKSGEGSAAVAELEEQGRELHRKFEEVVAEQAQETARLRENQALLVDGDGTEKSIPLSEMVRVIRPNTMSVGAKLRHYLAKVVELLTAEPREANTEGGLFPAIFGTVMMILLMSILSFPLGVVSGIYLREYAKDGFLVRLVRIAVNNLAGIPSIVYGIFGLGFFVYGVGASIDQFFFADRLPTPTFGTGGILWASLTLGLLTVPVVIVATEEALGAIPGGIREGSLAMGATQFQTLWRLLLPMASPGIMTGFILAMARAAGEVAPLMITGVVKLAPAMPVDGSFPYFHLDRKFMHLGFHIYDIGFQSPNVEAATPMVYVTTFLLLVIVVLMCSSAIYLRNKMKKKYSLGMM